MLLQHLTFYFLFAVIFQVVTDIYLLAVVGQVLQMLQTHLPVHPDIFHLMEMEHQILLQVLDLHYVENLSGLEQKHAVFSFLGQKMRILWPF
jgi:uncharacterized membrane protein YagU involved in acid resistance